MIVRSWGARTPLERGGAFHRHLLTTGIADYRSRAGCRNVLLLRRDEAGGAHFLLLSFWDSVDALRAYASENFEIAVSYPGDAAFGLEPDRFAQHWRVISTELE